MTTGSHILHFFQRQADASYRQWGKSRLLKHLFLLLIHCLITVLSFPVPSSLILAVYALILVLVIGSVWLYLPFIQKWLELPRPEYMLFLTFFFPFSTLVSILHLPPALAQGLVLFSGLIGCIFLCIPTGRRMVPPLSLALDYALCLSALLICLFSAEDYFSFQVDRYVPVVLVCTVLLGCMVYYLIAALPHIRFPRSASLLLVIAFLFCVTVLIQASYEPHHYSYFLGPVLEQLYGGRRPFVDLYAQYGLGMTTALTLYFKTLGFVSAESLLFLLKFLTFSTFVLLYLLGSSLYRSRSLAFLTVLAVFAFHFSFSAAKYYQTPSTTTLRFGLIYLVLIVWTMRRDLPSLPRWITDSALALVAALATLWSLDSFVYVVLPVIGWFILARQWRAFGGFLLRYTAFTLTFGCLMIAPSLLSNQPIDLSQYYAFQLLFSGGYYTNTVYDRHLLWMLFPVVYLFFIMRQMVNRDQDPRLTILALHGLAILTYFVWHPHWRVLFTVSIPFILLSVALLNQIAWPRRVALTLFLTIFLSSFYLYTVNVAMHRWVPLTTARDLEMMNPFSEHFALSESAFRRKHCPPELEKLRPVMVGQSLPLIFDRADGYNIFACLRSFNAFNIQPFALLDLPQMQSGLLQQIQQSPVSLFAISHMTGATIMMHGQTPDYTGELTRTVGWEFIKDTIIHPLHLKPIDAFSLYGEKIILYKQEKTEKR